MNDKKHFGRNKSFGKAKCGVCHKTFLLGQLKTIGLSLGFSMRVCKSKCYREGIKKELNKYLEIPLNYVDL